MQKKVFWYICKDVAAKTFSFQAIGDFISISNKFQMNTPFAEVLMSSNIQMKCVEGVLFMKLLLE